MVSTLSGQTLPLLGVHVRHLHHCHIRQHLIIVITINTVIMITSIVIKTITDIGPVHKAPPPVATQLVVPTELSDNPVRRWNHLYLAESFWVIHSDHLAFHINIVTTLFQVDLTCVHCQHHVRTRFVIATRCRYSLFFIPSLPDCMHKHVVMKFLTEAQKVFFIPNLSPLRVKSGPSVLTWALCTCLCLVGVWVQNENNSNNNHDKSKIKDRNKIRMMIWPWSQLQVHPVCLDPLLLLPTQRDGALLSQLWENNNYHNFYAKTFCFNNYAKTTVPIVIEHNYNYLYATILTVPIVREHNFTWFLQNKSSRYLVEFPNWLDDLEQVGWGTRLLIDWYPVPSFLLPQATSCWGSTKGGKEERRHKKVLEDLVNGKTPEVWWKVIKAQVDKKCLALQSGQQIVFAARTHAGWQLRVFGMEQDIK